MPAVFADAHHRAGDHRAEDEPVDAEDDAEQPVAGEAGERAAEHQQRSAAGQLVRRAAASRRLDLAPPFEALCIVTSSAYSRSLPTGTPMAMRVTRTPSGFSSRAR